jgi:excisionase family DNA binding protein
MQKLAVGVIEAGEMLSIAPRTIRAWIKSGRIRAVRLGRRVLVPVSELHRLIQDRPPEPANDDSPGYIDPYAVDEND